MIGGRWEGDLIMTKPLIAIVGSYDPSRTYEPPLSQDLETAKAAAAELGRELANAGYRILVYSSDPRYIEADVVRGYVASGKAEKESVQIRYPQELSKHISFPEQNSHKDIFDPVPDANPGWQVTFYRSLKDVNGIVMLGGAQSALITGMVAQAYSIPLITIGSFGGSAQTVWALSASRLMTEDERKVMNLPTWNDNSATRLIAVLGEQRKRLHDAEAARLRSQQTEDKKMRNRALLAVGLTVTAVLLTIFGTFSLFPSRFLFGIVFFGTPLLAGAAGGLARNIFDSYRGVAYQSEHNLAVITFLGMLAGLLAALLFVVAQLASNPEIKNLSTTIPPGLSFLIPFELIIGVIAGLTLESVFVKLLKTDVVNTDSVAVKGT